MDPTRFDQLAAVLATSQSRRGTLRALRAALFGTALGTALADVIPAAAKPRRQKRSRRGADRGESGDVGTAVCLRLGKRCKNRKFRCCGRAKCRNGRCRCSARQKQCGKACIARSACCRDRDCGGGGICRKGKCACPPRMKDCQGTCVPQGDCCTNGDCGDCESCVEGRCRSGCQPGQECQDGTCVCTTASCAGCCDENGTCRSGETDGACGTGGTACQVCGDHEDCTGGACVCDPGFTACGDPPVCVNTNTDPQHCGACAIVCAEHEVCVGGSCACADGFKPCQGGCIAESACCGGCPPETVCWQGQCEAPTCGNGGSCIAFVTSATFPGNFGGLTVADAACQQLADDADLPGTYLAWLSDTATSPADRFMHSPGPYVRVDGAVIAQNWDDLTDRAINVPIDLDETGSTVQFGLVWTGTEANGTATTDTCADWTEPSPTFGTNARTNRTNAGWSAAGGHQCSNLFNLYCFQQS